MNVIKNFASVKDAPLQTVSLRHLVHMLDSDINDDRNFAVVSRWVGPTHSTTVYETGAHQLYRTTTEHGILGLFKEIARRRENVRILGAKEVL